MKKITAAFILMFFIGSAKAQNENSKSNTEEEFKVIKMPKFPIADFPKKAVHVSVIEVVQLVKDSVRLGYVRKGLDNHVVQIKPAKNLTEFLQEQLDRMYKNDYKADGIKILFVLKELRLAERSAFMELAYTKFYATAYTSKDDKAYQEITSIDTILVRESGGDVTPWHGEDIQDAFKLLLKQTLADLKEGHAPATDAKSLAQIKAANEKQADIPILTATAYTEGAYVSFEEFIQNKPSVLIYQPVKEGKRKIRLVQMHENNQADTLNVWGLCKKGELYKYEEGFLIPIEKQENGFIISNYVKLASRRNNNNLGAMFGLLGMLGEELIKSANEKKQKEKLMLIKTIPYIRNENKQPEASCIDIKTGELSF